jgi:hypothetical protein
MGLGISLIRDPNFVRKYRYNNRCNKNTAGGNIGT